MSVDALRGFDMLFIMGGAGLIAALAQWFPCSFTEMLAEQMEHVEWNGLRHHDTIFPLFLFIAGISFPFSLAKQRGQGRTKWAIHRKVIVRGLMLVFLGVVYNGLLDFNETSSRLLRTAHGLLVFVETFDDRIDPVGACVGVKGARIHGIVRELRNENIDVINYTPNINLYIQRALAPAKIRTMEIDEENKKANVYLLPDEVSLAIGKGGYNVKLASMLTGYEIDVYREIDEEDMDDIYLDEFNDEIDQWVIDAFKAIGLDTAKEVLGTSKEDLLRRTDLEEETIDEVLRILAAEFAND